VQPVDVQESAPSLAAVAPAGLGTAWIAQLVPFQRSTNGRRPPPVVPTAMQRLLDGQDTPASSLSDPPPGSGIAWIAQLVPFHRSASVI